MFMVENRYVITIKRGVECKYVAWLLEYKKGEPKTNPKLFYSTNEFEDLVSKILESLDRSGNLSWLDEVPLTRAQSRLFGKVCNLHNWIAETRRDLELMLK